MAIPNIITRQHIINAIQRIGSPDNIPNIRRARRQALRYNNRNYPLKFVICIAHEIATGGQEYSYRNFTTNMARDYINSIGGFDVVRLLD
jgi:hypothetical protein